MRYFFLLITIFISFCYADTPGAKRKHLTLSASKMQVFCMFPPEYEKINGRYTKVDKGTGVAYELDDVGGFKKIWKLDGWYSHEVYLSKNGRYLVRVVFSHDVYERNKKDLAIVFYDKGQEMKKYYVSDLVTNLRYLSFSVGGYTWVKYDPKPYINNGVFIIHTHNKLQHHFDVATGELIKKVKVKQEGESTLHKSEPVPDR